MIQVLSGHLHNLVVTAHAPSILMNNEYLKFDCRSWYKLNILKNKIIGTSSNRR
jgi:hypothetical protein